MVLHITELRNQIFRVFKMVDAGKEVTIIKKDSNKRYRLVPIKDNMQDIEKVAQEMSTIKLKTLNHQKMKEIFETRYE